MSDFREYIKTKGFVDFATGFAVLGPNPIDARFIVPDTTYFESIDEQYGAAYHGLKVFVEAENKFYTYKKNAEGEYAFIADADNKSIVTTEIINGHLIIHFNDDTILDAGEVVGPAGEPGEKGDKGDKGDQGEVGPTGAKGATGATGPTGPTGATGPIGAAGLTTSVKFNGLTYTQIDGLITIGGEFLTKSETEAALGSKQDSLTTNQLNAINSGITDVGVTQITTNKNNINSL